MRRYRKHYEKDWQLFLECMKCWEYKLPTEFSKKWWRQFWVRTTCKECEKEYWKRYREENHEHRIEICRKYHEEHKEQEKEYNREYRKTHKEICFAQLNRYPQKRKARWMTYNFIRYNWIEKPRECSVCWKESKVEIHHPDYDKWNSIVFCCKKCHAIIHRWDKVEYKPIDLLKI